MNRLESLVLEAKKLSAKLAGSRTTIVHSTEAALYGYGLHRQLDKLSAEFLPIDALGDSDLHGWDKSCCTLLGLSEAVAEQLCRQRYHRS